MIEKEDISRATEYILDAVALGQYSATQIAAAFMKMQLGEEIADIKEEKFFFERKGRTSGRGGKGQKKPFKGGALGSVKPKDVKPKDVKRDGSYDRRGYDRRDTGRNNRYGALRIKTK